MHRNGIHRSSPRWHLHQNDANRMSKFLIKTYISKTNTKIREERILTALFTNMRILKFKSQLMIAYFATVNHLNGPLRKQNFTLTDSKGQGLRFVIGVFRSVSVCFRVSRFVACDRNYDWRQRKTQLWRRLLNFRVRMFVKSAVSND